MVYKFGGAALATAQRIKNVANIITATNSPLIVIVSAIGKSTNNLEAILDSYISGNTVTLNELLTSFVAYHQNIVNDLELPQDTISIIVSELKGTIFSDSLFNTLSYSEQYDTIVPFGELLSSAIVNGYLKHVGVDCSLIDARNILVTNDIHQDATVDIEATKVKYNNYKQNNRATHITISQGFIGATSKGVTTTLGREGSDYSAAIFAVVTSSSTLTIWKDVIGVLNCDPRRFDSPELIEHLSYKDAVELSYNGAQIIHPKTIRPLENNQITLYVRSFIEPTTEGTIINSEPSTIMVPIITIKENQTLITISPLDFSFALEECLEHIFSIINRWQQRVNMVQNSAVTISIVVDNSKRFSQFIEELSEHFRVTYNCSLELVTIQGETTNRKVKMEIEQQKTQRRLYLLQETRKLTRLIGKKI